MPNHIALPDHRGSVERLNLEGEPRKAPGAMSAIALMVNPVSPRVGLADVCPAFLVMSDIGLPVSVAKFFQTYEAPCFTDVEQCEFGNDV